MKRTKNPWDYNSFLKPICGAFTDHRHHKLLAWDASFSDGGYKYANRHDFYYKCKLCGYVFFNNHVSDEDLEYIKEWNKNHAREFEDSNN